MDGEWWLVSRQIAGRRPKASEVSSVFVEIACDANEKTKRSAAGLGNEIEPSEMKRLVNGEIRRQRRPEMAAWWTARTLKVAEKNDGDEVNQRIASEERRSR